MRTAAGLGMCNITKCCTEVCPEHIKITDNGIIPLKERVGRRRLRPGGLAGPQDRSAPQDHGRGSGGQALAGGVPRYLTPEWADAFNEALAHVAWTTGPTEGSLAAASGRFSVSQEVHDVPPDGAAVCTTLVMDEGRLRLHFHRPEEPDREGRADVTIALDYPDAVALFAVRSARSRS